jgi:hypothetical protein
MDIEFLGADPQKARGYEAMNILHYLGLKREFQGLFVGMNEDKSIRYLENDEQDFSEVISIINLTGKQHPPFVRYPDELASDKKYREGRTKVIRVNAYERNPKARKKCIEHHGARCAVCGFDFQKVYGEMGEGFIHVHHLKEIASKKKEYVIDPVKDLRPVCPNCHAMIHTRKPAIPVSKMKRLLKG